MGKSFGAVSIKSIGSRPSVLVQPSSGDLLARPNPDLHLHITHTLGWDALSWPLLGSSDAFHFLIDAIDSKRKEAVSSNVRFPDGATTFAQLPTSQPVGL